MRSATLAALVQNFPERSTSSKMDFFLTTAGGEMSLAPFRNFT